MKYLNIGCGMHYSIAPGWTNLDFTSTGESVIAYNLLAGIPFADGFFDVVYHSHVLEHFSKEDGEKLIAECFRVLKPGGVLRIAIPDLEAIAKNYLHFLNEGIGHPDDKIIQANYEWTLLEMYDQTVRQQNGGNMGIYLVQDKIINEDFVVKRVGGESLDVREMYKTLNDTSAGINGALKKIKNWLKTKLEKFAPYKKYKLGAFRLGGEIHQWMYDRYSLTKLLKDAGGTGIEKRDAFSSYITDWASFEIDGKYPTIRKPDSLFMETIKA